MYSKIYWAYYVLFRWEILIKNNSCVNLCEKMFPKSAKPAKAS
jgi:hypothetical protein